MVELRKGDIITLKAVVEDAAPYDGGQQVYARILPRGKHLGWCLQSENAFEPHTLRIKVGDRVHMIDRPCHQGGWEVKSIFENGQVAVQKRSDEPVQLTDLKNLRRI